MSLPELLMPAGDIERAYTAFRYGADAIYCGLAAVSLRTRENYFSEENIAEIIDFAHKHNKKVYVTINAFPHQAQMGIIKKHLQFLAKTKPDGIIFADLGVLALANEFAPKVPKHLSVQTSTMNLPAMQMWQQLGVTRIICAREMAIAEVKKINQQLPEMELEYFVHGSVCMAYSGRCLLSNFTGGRDANRGACNHTCRWKYKLLEEEKRPGELMPIEEDRHGTHIMSSRDMCMIEHLAEIQAAGVCSLKVEGRHKTAYYAATIARAYRNALDDLAAGKDFNQKLWDEVQATANRGFFPGFLHGKPQSGDIQYEANRSTSQKEVAAIAQNWQAGRAEIIVKNQIKQGNKLEVVMPKMSDDFSFIAKDLQFGEKSVDTLHGGNNNKIASLACKQELPQGVFLRQLAQLKHPV